LRPLAILMIAPTPFFADRGCHVRIYEEIKFLRRQGHRVVLLTYPIGRDRDDIDIRRVPGVPWYRKLSAGPSLHKFYLDPLMALKGLAIARRERPDLLHVHLHEGIAIGLPIARLTGLPMVADLQGSLVEELVDHRTIYPGGLAYRLLRAFERWLAGRADHIVVSSKNTSDMLRRLYALEEGRISRVGDGVDVDDFYPQAPDAALREELSIPEDARVVVFLGLLTRYQGVDLLLEAFTRVVAAVPRAHLVVMGYPNVAHYRELAESMMLSGRVTFTGRVPYERARDFLTLGEVAVAPKMSLTEANGKLYNYMACALPVVTFDTPVNREILGDLGRYARPGDRESLADRVIELLNEPERARTIGAELRRTVEASFSWARSVERIVERYERLLDGRDGRPDGEGAGGHEAGRRAHARRPGQAGGGP
jgi:glycosyltransferase involved in cell wall biosynthesis